MNALHASLCAPGCRFVCPAGTHRICVRLFEHRRPDRKNCGKPLCALVAERGQALQSLEQWCRRSKIELQQCKLDASQSQPALSASAGAQAGQTLLTVPQPLWITVQVVAKSDIGAAVSHLDGWLQLALYLLLCRQQANSPLSDYVDSLPESLDVPLLWTDAQLALLEGTQILSTVEGYRCSTA